MKSAFFRYVLSVYICMHCLISLAQETHFDNEAVSIVIPDGWKLKSQPDERLVQLILDYPDSSKYASIELRWLPPAQTMMMERKGTPALAMSLEQQFGPEISLLATEKWGEATLNQFQVVKDEQTVGLTLYIHSHFSQDYGIALMVGVDTTIFPVRNHPALIKEMLGLDSDLIPSKKEVETGLTSTQLADANILAKNNQEIVGEWETASKNVEMTSGPFSVLVAIAISKWGVSNEVGGENARGTNLTYQFEPSGKYFATYEGVSSWGVMQSGINVVEQGTFYFQENMLTLIPIDYQGTVYNGSSANKKPIHIKELPERIYKVVRAGNQLLLYGICGAFQVEPYCEKEEQVLFPLVRK